MSTAVDRRRHLRIGPETEPIASWPTSVDVRLGVWLTLASAIAGVIWCAGSDAVRHPELVWGVLALTALLNVAAGVLVFACPRATTRMASILLPLWSYLCVGSVLAVLVAVDDATHPVVLFLCVPLAFSALAYPFPAALSVSCLAWAGWLVVALVLGTDGAELTLTATALAAVGGLCIRQAMSHRRQATAVGAAGVRHLALARLSAEALNPLSDPELLAATAVAMRDGAPHLDGAVIETVGDGIPAVRVSTTDDRVRRARLRAAGPGDGALITGVDCAPTFDGQLVALPRTGAITADDAQFLAGLGDVLCGALRRRHADATLRRQALHDALTGLPNRRLLEQRLAHAVAAAGPGAFTAVLLLDLDGFKDINDVFGHGTGDAVLRAAAARLRSALRPDDSLARLGGDEFVALCDGLAGPDEAVAIARRLLTSLRDPVAVATADGGSSTHALRASVGVACVPGASAAPAQAHIRDADLAMYEAKGAGRNRVALFDERTRRVAVQQAELVTDLRNAVVNGELRLVFQPLVRLSDAHPVGAEALLRWNHPERGEVSPAQFIPAAEHAGMMGEIGGWVLDHGIARLRDWAQDPATAGLRLSINVSAAQLSGLADEVERRLLAAGVAASRLVVELTETALLDERDGTWAELEQLRRLGVGVALDDFGTGFSSLSHVAHFPVTEIKLDRAFVGGLVDRPADAAVAEAVCLMARRIDAEVVAEGIETEAQAQVLRGLGAGLGQGYLFARPLELDAFVATMSEVSTSAGRRLAPGCGSASSKSSARPTSPPRSAATPMNACSRR